MLKVPQKLNNALDFMTRLAAAQNAGLGPVSLESAARDGGVSQGYLEEIVRHLRDNGLVTVRRGAHGGYALPRPATEITAADVMTALLGGSWAVECIGERTRFAMKHAASGSATRPAERNAALWRRVQGQVMTTLRGVTVAELAMRLASDTPTAFASEKN